MNVFHIASGASGSALILFVKVANVATSDGQPLVGLDSTSGFIVGYKRDSDAASVPCSIGDASALGTYSGASQAFAIKEVDQDYLPGVYEIHLPSEFSTFASGSKVVVSLWGATNAEQIDFVVHVGQRVVLGSDGLDHVSTSDTLSSTSLGSLTFRERLLIGASWPTNLREDDDGSVSGTKKLSLYNAAGTDPIFEWVYTKADGVTSIAAPTLHIH